MPDEPRAERPSKTRLKREAHALQELGARLVGLPENRLRELPLPEALADAVHEARRIGGHEARRRQLQYIGRIMRDTDATAIRARLAAWDGDSVEDAARLREIERWRERLLADGAALTEFARLHPHADLQRLRMLVRNARSEADARRPPHSYRELFRALRALLPEPAPAARREPDGAR
jgi:ribosome-associated protein